MCLGDWRLGNVLAEQRTIWNLATSVGLTYPANPGRVGIIIAYGGTASSSVLQVKIDGNPFVFITSNLPIIMLDLTNSGKLCQRKFDLVASSGTPQGLVIEHFLPQEMLNLNLDDLRSMYKP